MEARHAILCRQEGQQRRDQQEAQNIGSFQHAFPSPDPGKQALYERLLAGAQEHFQSSFQAKAHVMIDTLQVSLLANEESYTRVLPSLVVAEASLDCTLGPRAASQLDASGYSRVLD